MQEDRYDEFQIAKRHRLGYQAFALTMVLIIVNGIVKMNYLWANPLMEMMVLLYIPMTYLTVRLIVSGAYIRKKVKNPNVYIPMFGMVSLFSLFVIVQSIWSDVFAPIRDGKLDNSAGILFIAAYTILITIAMIMRRAADFRIMRSEG
jgi:hypothetical protein